MSTIRLHDTHGTIRRLEDDTKVVFTYLLDCDRATILEVGRWYLDGASEPLVTNGITWERER